LGGEAFTVATLRRAHAMASSQHDREHVTPWIRRNCTMTIHTPQGLETADFSHLRCTIDDEEDYKRVVRLFEGVADPIRIGWLELTKKLARLPGEPEFRLPYRVSSRGIQSELTLGTAQLGMEYGIVNREGQPPPQLAIRMVRAAIAHGVKTLDTARAYGEAEAVLGEALKGTWRARGEGITKTHPLPAIGPVPAPSESLAAADRDLGRAS